MTPEQKEQQLEEACTEIREQLVASGLTPHHCNIEELRIVLNEMLQAELTNCFKKAIHTLCEATINLNATPQDAEKLGLEYLEGVHKANKTYFSAIIYKHFAKGKDFNSQMLQKLGKVVIAVD